MFAPKWILGSISIFSLYLSQRWIFLMAQLAGSSNSAFCRMFYHSIRILQNILRNADVMGLPWILQNAEFNRPFQLWAAAISIITCSNWT